MWIHRIEREAARCGGAADRNGLRTGIHRPPRRGLPTNKPKAPKLFMLSPKPIRERDHRHPCDLHPVSFVVLAAASPWCAVYLTEGKSSIMGFRKPGVKFTDSLERDPLRGYRADVESDRPRSASGAFSDGGPHFLHYAGASRTDRACD